MCSFVKREYYAIYKMVSVAHELLLKVERYFDSSAAHGNVK